MLSQAQSILQNLGSNHVDILYIHAPDHSTPYEETLAALQQLYEGQKFSLWEKNMRYILCKHSMVSYVCVYGAATLSNVRLCSTRGRSIQLKKHQNRYGKIIRREMKNL